MPEQANGNCVAIDKTDGKLHTYDCDTLQYPLCEDTSTTTTEIQCGKGFTMTAGGCFYVETSNMKTWRAAELTCRGICGKSHLAVLDTQEVSTFMLY